MAIGDDAIAAGMDVVEGTTPANTLDTEITLTRDYIAQFHALAMGAFGNYVPVSAVVADPATGPYVNLIPKYDNAARLVCAFPTAANHATPKNYVDQAITNVADSLDDDFVGKTGNHTMQGNLVVNGNVFVPNATPASTNYTVAYINGDGRLSEGASTQRVKHAIDRAPELPDLFAVPIASFVMNADPDETTRYGPIAEDLADNPATASFVIYDADGLPKSFDQMSYLMAAAAILHTRVAQLEARVAELEAAAS